MSYGVCVAMVGIIFVLLLLAQGSASAMTAPGLRFFESTLFVELAFITLAAVSYFASAITEEKEEGTLPLLRMTDLDPLAILLGKSTSRLSGALLLLAATLPFTLLAVTLGGISARQVLASYATLGSYLILLANVALLSSVLSPRGAVASMMTGVVVFGTPTLSAMMMSAAKWVPALPIGRKAAFLVPWLISGGEFLDTLNPFKRLGEVLSTGFNGPLLNAQFSGSLLTAGVCLGLAWLLFDPIAGETRRFGLARPVPKSDGRFEKLSPGRTWLVSAPAWKDYHFLYGGTLMALAKWVLYSVTCCVVAYNGMAAGKTVSEVGTSVIWIASLGLGVELCLIGSRVLRVEIRDKTLVGLAGLPLSMRHIMMMKLSGARRSLVPAFCWFCFGIVVSLSGMFYVGVAKNDVSQLTVLPSLLGIAYLASQIWLLAHLAAHFSLKLKWGALPLSLAVIFIANLIGAMFCIGFFVMPIVALTYVTQLRSTIYQKLEQMAGED